MRVLHVAESIKGGVGSYLSNLAPYQAKELGSNNVRFLIPHEHREQLAGVDGDAINGYPRPDRSSASLRSLASSLRTEVDHFNPHVIHAHSTFAGVVVRTMFGRRSASPTVIYCPHGWAFNIKISAWKRRVFEGVERSLAPFSEAVIAISRHERSEGRRIGIASSKLHLILNGAPDLDPTPVIDESWRDTRLKVLFVGRLDRQKGIDILLEAVTPLQNEVSLRIIGDPVVNTRPVHLPENAVALGWLGPAAIGAQLASCDVVVVPSRWEGFGFVAVEAMRASKPVIAAQVGGLAEILGDGDCGRLVAPESPQAIRDALLSMDAPTREAMGARGRQRFLTQFTAERMSNSLTELYHRFGSERSLKARRPWRSVPEQTLLQRFEQTPPATLSPIARDHRFGLPHRDDAIR